MTKTKEQGVVDSGRASWRRLGTTACLALAVVAGMSLGACGRKGDIDSSGNSPSARQQGSTDPQSGAARSPSGTGEMGGSGGGSSSGTSGSSSGTGSGM